MEVKMTYVLALFCLSLSMTSSGDSRSNDELYCAISNVVSMIQIKDVDTTEDLLSGLENQFAYAKLRYGWDIQGVTDVDSIRLSNNVHGHKAAQLERMKLLIDYKLEEMILLERLKQMNEMQSKVNEVNPQAPYKVCVDVEDFLKQLENATVVEYKYMTYFSTFKKGSIVVSDKKTIRQLRDFFLSLDLECNPALWHNSVNYIDFKPLYVEPTYYLSKFDTNGESEIIINNSISIKIYSKRDLLCFGNAYRCSDESRDLVLEIKSTLEQGEGPNKTE